MHIPDAMLTGAVCPVTAAITTLGLSATAYAAWKTVKKPSAMMFAGVSALIFAGQMLNFPVQAGTSGHLIGATLAVALLGVPFGILAMALTVTVQCFVFADGGIGILGANLLNMALIASLPMMLISGKVKAKNRDLLNNSQLSTFNLQLLFAALCSVVLAAAACSAELAAAGIVPLGKVLPAMLGVHLLIGIGEAGITLLAYFLITQYERKFSVLAIAVLAAVAMSPFACTFPDGLESVSEALHFFRSAEAPAFVTPFTDYVFPLISSAVLSTMLAGLAGVVLMFTAGFGLRKIFGK